MDIWQAVLLGIVEGVTEFLPVSSTGHLTIVEKLLGYSVGRADITAFTAIIQVGAVLATIVYFRNDLIRIITAWTGGLLQTEGRRHPDYRFGWAIIIGSVPIAIVGLAAKDFIEKSLRSLWLVAGALIVWSLVMWYADHRAGQSRPEGDVTWKDTLLIGTVQCLALIPGVSRSGATMSAGLLRGFNRVTVTRLSFFLSIPALCAAGVLEAGRQYGAISQGVGWPATIIATVISFIVAYVSIAWLLKYIARHTYSIFIYYRIALGIILLALLASGVLSAS